MTTNPAIPFLDADAIRRSVSVADLLDAVEAAYRDVAAGRDRSPLRSHVGLADGTLLLMPGVRDGGAGVSVKLVTVMPGNAARGLPTIPPLIAWFDAASGRPLAVLDGAEITAMRTGAASGVATRLLAHPTAATLGIIGAGAQAAWQIRAVLGAGPIQRVLIYARDAHRRADFARTMADETGIEVTGADSAEHAVRESEVICCVTTAAEPIFDAAWVQPGTHVNGIGAFRPGMVELPPALFARAALVAVDAREAALAEAGDVLAAIEAGAIAESGLVEIGTIDGGWVTSRDPQAITVFKSVGLAIQDVAAAGLVVSRLVEAG